MLQIFKVEIDGLDSSVYKTYFHVLSPDWDSVSDLMTAEITTLKSNGGLPSDYVFKLKSIMLADPTPVQ